MEKKERILIVDDDRIIGHNLKLILEEEGYEVVVADKGFAAIEEIKKQPFNVVLLDLILPDIGGIELLRMFGKKFFDTCFIISTGFASLSSAIEALKAGAYDYLIKPYDGDHVKLVIKRGIERQRLSINYKELIERLEKDRRKMEVVLEAYKTISSIFELDELADFVTARAIEIVEAEKSSLMVIDEDSGQLVVRGLKGSKKNKAVWRKDLGEMVAGWVAKQGEILLVKDIDADPRLRHYAKQKRYKTGSFISMPLKADGRIIGVINVADKFADTKIFTEEDLRYLSLLAHQTVAQIENIRLCEKLASLAITDALTGLFNHRYFQEELNLEIARAKRYKRTLSLIMLDIDSFKEYNDTYGHLEGNNVLKEFARIMQDNIRQIDKPSRYGGEEFMIILPEADIEEARVVAERVRKKAERMRIDLGVTISAGVAAYREGMSKEELISRADQALYKAKSEGKNKVCLFEK
ncbi:MAG: diguanylate cyclase [Candidatus Omnitrophota bacterium]